MKIKSNQILTDDQITRKDHYNELIKHLNYKDKIFFAKKRIREFLQLCELKKDIDEITISFSGGKDSTVLLDLVIKVHQEVNCKIPIVIIYATEITFPSTIKFIKQIGQKYQKEYPNILKKVEIIYPKKTWNEILKQNGYPIFSKQISTLINRVKRAKTKNHLCLWFFNINKNQISTSRYNLSTNRLFLLDDNILFNWPDISADEKMVNYFKKYNENYFFSEKCCDFIKGNLKHDYRPSFIGTMAEESLMRKNSWINNGCNIFNEKIMKSRPLSLWTSNDVWKYIKENNLEINEAYGFDHSKNINEQNLDFNRLGCVSCPYGSFVEQRIIERINKNNKTITKLNRFEVLKQKYPNLYLSQVINNGMYKILIDMDVKINNDQIYMKLYNLRRKQINEWYSPKKFRENLILTMCQIENNNDYKQKGEKYIWSYTVDEFNQALSSFNLKYSSLKEITKYRNIVKKNYFNLKK